jgi:DNA-binding transcriptional LysR family regulator
LYDFSMELRHLRYFVVVAQEVNFTRAAQRLRIAQPALSSQIKKLEQELGVRLFERVGRGVRLTEAGQLLLEEARHHFVQIEQTVRVVQETGHGEVGRLSLGFIPAASNNILPPILREFRNRFPKVELFLREMMPDEAVQGLHDGRVDLSFSFFPFEDETVRCKVICRESLVVALPETHPLACESKVEMRALADEPFILPAQYSTPSLYGKVMDICRQAGFAPKAVQKDVGLMQTIIGLVAGEIGVALVPASLRNLTRKGVVYREVQGFTPTVEMSVMWRRDNTRPVLSSFLQVVDDVSKSAQEEALAG